MHSSFNLASVSGGSRYDLPFFGPLLCILDPLLCPMPASHIWWGKCPCYLGNCVTSTVLFGIPPLSAPAVLPGSLPYPKASGSGSSERVGLTIYHRKQLWCLPAICIVFSQCLFRTIDNLSPTQYAEHQLRKYSAQSISWIGSVQLFLTVCVIFRSSQPAADSE